MIPIGLQAFNTYSALGVAIFAVGVLFTYPEEFESI
jgi:hypothetical protein